MSNLRFKHYSTRIFALQSEDGRQVVDRFNAKYANDFEIPTYWEQYTNRGFFIFVNNKKMIELTNDLFYGKKVVSLD